MPPERRRDEILDAALELFSRRGWENVSLADVLAAAEISKGGFYHHFASKEALLEGIVQRLVEETVESLLGKAGCEGPVERLASFLGDTSLLTTAREAELRVIVDTARSAEHAGDHGGLVRRITEAKVATIRPRLVALIEEGTRTGAFQVADAGLAADLILAVGQGRRVAFAGAMEAWMSGNRHGAAHAIELRFLAEWQSIERLLGLPADAIAGRIDAPGDLVLSRLEAALARDDQSDALSGARPTPDHR